MSSLPPPDQAQNLRVGSLTPAWKFALVATQLLILVSLVLLGISALTVGKPTWWLAATDNNLTAVLVVVPFLAPSLVILAAARASHLAPLAGLLATAVLAATSVVDISRTPGIALGEAILAGCTALTTIAVFAGRRRAINPAL
ncbi:MAG: hypothetical protein ACKOH9_06945 [Actinomycetota bacterium]